jgi:hypothetical protein
MWGCVSGKTYKIVMAKRLAVFAEANRITAGICRFEVDERRCATFALLLLQYFK